MLKRAACHSRQVHICRKKAKNKQKQQHYVQAFKDHDLKLKLKLKFSVTLPEIVNLCYVAIQFFAIHPSIYNSNTQTLKY